MALAWSLWTLPNATSLCLLLSSSSLSPADLFADYIFLQRCLIALFCQVPQYVPTQLVSLDSWSLGIICAFRLDFIGVFQSVTRMLQGKQYCELHQRPGSPTVNKPGQQCFTQQTPDFLNTGILLCNSNCLSLELVSCRTRFGNVDTDFIYVCWEVIPSGAEAVERLRSRVAFTWWSV